RSCLELDQPVSGLGKNGEFGQLAADHCDFIAAVKTWTNAAIFINFVRQIFSMRHGKAELGEKFRLSSKKANAGERVHLRLREQLMNSFRIRENRLTRAHACSPARD